MPIADRAVRGAGLGAGRHAADVVRDDRDKDAAHRAAARPGTGAATRRARAARARCRVKADVRKVGEPAAAADLAELGRVELGASGVGRPAPRGRAQVSLEPGGAHGVGQGS